MRQGVIHLYLYIYYLVYEDGAVIVGSVDGNRIWGKELKNVTLAGKKIVFLQVLNCIKSFPCVLPVVIHVTAVKMYK